MDAARVAGLLVATFVAAGCASAPGPTVLPVSAPVPTEAPGVEVAAATADSTSVCGQTNAGSQGFPTLPLPDGNPPPLSRGTFRSIFREPLPSSPVWNPPGPKCVGLQAGHWLTDDVPDELHNLGPGAEAGGWDEWEVNLLIAQAAAKALESDGVQVELLPTTIPI